MTAAEDTDERARPMRLGDFARATGLRPQMIQRWEKRYGFPDGGRTPGGHRCYTAEDVTRVLRLVALRESGMTLQAAIRAVTDPALVGGGANPDASDPEFSRQFELGVVRADLLEALDDLDEPRLWSLLQRACDTIPAADLIEHVVFPAMRTTDDPEDLRHPERLQAYLFSRLVVAAFTGLLARHRHPEGQLVWLACPEGEAHEVGTLAAAVLLAERGLDVRYLGTNVPLPTVLAGARRARPAAILLGVTRSLLIRDRLPLVEELCQVSRVFIGGRGAWRAHAVGTRALVLDDDVVTSADLLARLVAEAESPTG